MRVAETRKKNYKAYEENQKNCCSDSIFHMEYIFHQHIKVLWYLQHKFGRWGTVPTLYPADSFGAVKYNGMTAEKAIYAWIKSEFLMPKKLVFHSTNVYYELMKSSIEQKQKDHFWESKT